MKKIVALALVAALFGACGTAQAAKVWDDMSWWGNTGATPDPQADSKGRSGYWWWPKDPASNAADGELWGNRGIVYSQWIKPKPAEKPPVPGPTPSGHVIHTAIVLNNVLFDFDKAVLKAEGKAEVGKLVAEMKKWPKDTVVINGHTCNVGADDYNMGLGQRRADAVKTYLIENGVAAGRIKTKSLGETKPAVSNDTPASRKDNRRAEFKVTAIE